MKIFKTIRGQLTLYFVLVFGIMLCVFSIILYNVFANQNREDLDKSMQLLAGAINEEMQNDSIIPQILNEANEIFIPFTSSGQVFVELLDVSGNVVLKSAHYKNQDLNPERQLFDKALEGNQVLITSGEDIEDNNGNSNGTRVLLYPVSYNSNKFVIIIGVPLSNLEGALFKFRLLLYITVPFTLLLSSILGWIFSKKAYAPVNDIINNSNSITANNLGTRLPVSDTGDEISKLASTLNNMMERLQKSFVVLKQFTSDASHELRTPLTILKGEIEVALNMERPVSEYKRILKDNLEEVDRLQKIVDGLLVLSQLESGKTQIYSERINLNELLTEAVTKINSLASKKDIKVILKFNGTKDDNFKQSHVKGDYSKLLNVFINLLDNSIKYSNSGCEITCIEDFNSVENKVEVSIKDNGVGIPYEKLENIFDRFYRADLSRAKDDRKSAGLGLSIVKSVIESHHGNISVKSALGRGTTFTITLPYFFRIEIFKVIFSILNLLHSKLLIFIFICFSFLVYIFVIIQRKQERIKKMKNLIIAVTSIVFFMFFIAYGQTVPSSVVDAFNKKFPDVSKVKWDKENAHEYEASFKLNDIKCSANFSNNGEWLETETATSFDKLPQEVQVAFNKDYKGYTAKAVSSIETSKGAAKYEIEYEKGKKTVELFYDENGNNIK